MYFEIWTCKTVSFISGGGSDVVFHFGCTGIMKCNDVVSAWQDERMLKDRHRKIIS